MTFTNTKRLVSYLQKSKRDVWIYETEDHLFLGDGFVLFRVKHDAGLFYYYPPTKNTIYVKQVGKTGSFLEDQRNHPMNMWNDFMNDQERIHEVVATNQFCQMDEKLFVRKFVSSSKDHVVLIKKELTDILDTLAIDLNHEYQFELKEKAFLRVHRRSFYTGEQSTPLAILMPYGYKEEE